MEKFNNSLKKVKKLQTSCFIVYLINVLLMFVSCFIVHAFSWRFIFLILILLINIAGFIILVKVKTKTDYLKASIQDYYQILTTLCFTINVRFVIIICNKIVKSNMMLNNYHILLIALCVVSVLSLIFALIIQVLTPLVLRKIYKPVWEQKKKLKEETKKYNDAINLLIKYKNQTKEGEE